MKITQSGFMFGCPFQMRTLTIVSDSLFFYKVLHTDIFDGIPCLFIFFDLALVLRVRAVTNPFPDPSIFIFDSEDVVSILSRLSNFSEIFKILFLFKVKRSSLSLIYLCFLTLRWPQFLMFTDTNKSWFLPVNFSSQNVFRVEQPWQIDGDVTTNRNFMLI